MKRQPPLTPTALRTGYHKHLTARPSGQPAGPLPRVAFDTDADEFEQWMAHVDARRIQVR